MKNPNQRWKTWFRITDKTLNNWLYATVWWKMEICFYTHTHTHRRVCVYMSQILFLNKTILFVKCNISVHSCNLYIIYIYNTDSIKWICNAIIFTLGKETVQNHNALSCMQQSNTGRNTNTHMKTVMGACDWSSKERKIWQTKITHPSILAATSYLRDNNDRDVTTLAIWFSAIQQTDLPLTIRCSASILST